ncbi:hypothetical protein NL676_002347 [Syzygium grande]|nr:hypothetical protein NL676_002347 [Syzygium grande]
MASHSSSSPSPSPPNAKPIPSSASGGGGGGGGRKPQPVPWTHEETVNLIRAYGEKWYALKRGPLKSSQWEEVAVTVAARCGYSYAEPSKTATQCRHKMEKLRKRYRAEKQQRAGAGGASGWPYYELMVRLERGPMPISARPIAVVPYGARRAVDGGGGDEEDGEEEEEEAEAEAEAAAAADDNERRRRGLRWELQQVEEHKPHTEEAGGGETVPQGSGGGRGEEEEGGGGGGGADGGGIGGGGGGGGREEEEEEEGGVGDSGGDKGVRGEGKILDAIAKAFAFHS